LLGLLPCLRAQEQEGKLVDRLLRPNMTLESSEQHKTFTADKTGMSKKANVKTAYLQQKNNTKAFVDLRDYSTTTSNSNSWAFNASGNHTNEVAREKKAPRKTYGTTMLRTPVTLRDGTKVASTNEYAGSRKFVEKGKSQKFLDRKNPPMTIEQVRELLNKNK